MINFMRKVKRFLIPGKNIHVSVMVSAPGEELKGGVFIITGGGSGIGKATAALAVKQGAEVIILGRREEKLLETAKELGKQCKYYVADVTKVSDFNHFWSELESIYNKKITGLVCNAGIYTNKAPFDFAESDFQNTYLLNTIAPARMIQSFVSYCVRNKIEGKVVVTASNRGLFGDYGPYGMSKAAIISYVQGMARTYLKAGIRINAVAPGMTASEINHIDVEGNMYTGSAKGERVLLPDEIAEVIVFLLSNRAYCINGAVIPCDEGDFLR